VKKVTLEKEANRLLYIPIYRLPSANMNFEFYYWGYLAIFHEPHRKNFVVAAIVNSGCSENLDSETGLRCEIFRSFPYYSIYLY
jgi:hypothetical protein